MNFQLLFTHNTMTTINYISLFSRYVKKKKTKYKINSVGVNLYGYYSNNVFLHNIE